MLLFPQGEKRRNSSAIASIFNTAGAKTDRKDWMVLERNSYSIPRTAADQGKYCVDHGLTIDKSQLVPGDLIFFSHKTNDRFMNITHVAIYAGMKDGNHMVVDASSSKGKVVYRKLYSGAVLYGRMYK